MFNISKLQTVQFLDTLEFRLPSPAYVGNVWEFAEGQREGEPKRGGVAGNGNAPGESRLRKPKIIIDNIGGIF